MRRLLLAFLFAVPLGALAAEPQTVVLDVQNMTCELCPITVKKALDKVPGVAATKIDLAKKCTESQMFFDCVPTMICDDMRVVACDPMVMPEEPVVFPSGCIPTDWVICEGPMIAGPCK